MKDMMTTLVVQSTAGIDGLPLSFSLDSSCPNLKNEISGSENTEDEQKRGSKI